MPREILEIPWDRAAFDKKVAPIVKISVWPESNDIYVEFALCYLSEGPEDNYFGKPSEGFCGLMGVLQEISVKAFKKDTVTNV